MQDNTDVARFTASLMGEEDFGYVSSLYELCDLDAKKTEDALLSLNSKPEYISLDGEGIKVSFSSDNKYLYLPMDCGEYTDVETKNVAAIRITYTNNSAEHKYLPALAVRGDTVSSTSSERISYIAPGETRTYTYVFDSGVKNNGVFNSADELVLTMRTGSVDLTITDITIVNRPFNK